MLERKNGGYRTWKECLTITSFGSLETDLFVRSVKELLSGIPDIGKPGIVSVNIVDGKARPSRSKNILTVAYSNNGILKIPIKRRRS